MPGPSSIQFRGQFVPRPKLPSKPRVDYIRNAFRSTFLEEVASMGADCVITFNFDPVSETRYSANTLHLARDIAYVVSKAKKAGVIMQSTEDAQAISPTGAILFDVHDGLVDVDKFIYDGDGFIAQPVKGIRVPPSDPAHPLYGTGVQSFA